MATNEKLKTLERIEAWVKGAQKDVEYIIKVFENTFHEKLGDC